MDAVDLRDYFPPYAVHVYNKSTGTENSRFTFQKTPTPMDNLYTNYLDINKPGYTYMWRKEYKQSGAWCTATYAVLRMGDDKSVTEVGDWLASTPCTPNTVFGYKTPEGVTSGILWSGPGGLSDNPVLAEVDVWRQNTPGAVYAFGGSKAYSRTGMIEHLVTFTPRYGRDSEGVWREGGSKTYTDVVRVVMYHGTKRPNTAPIRCVGPIAANGVYYQSYKDYNSYAMEIYLAKGVGIIQHNTPFIEDGTFWGIPNCNGDIFNNPGAWVTYIDQQ